MKLIFLMKILIDPNFICKGKHLHSVEIVEMKAISLLLTEFLSLQGQQNNSRAIKSISLHIPLFGTAAKYRLVQLERSQPTIFGFIDRIDGRFTANNSRSWRSHRNINNSLTFNETNATAFRSHEAST